ncbi:hypothetical protein [Streptomyces sp. NPDC060031]|uniref:hypothetical protein n=1 Tax=Streptomyces sp. NPDC060031 TaxID=3347043 RepID=UPI0036982B51
MVVAGEWPERGRIGLCRSGEYAGAYALLVPEVPGWWVCYLGDANGTAVDDFTVTDESVTEVVESMAITWLDGPEAELREREVFGYWDEWSARQTSREPGRLSRFLRRKR